MAIKKIVFLLLILTAFFSLSAQESDYFMELRFIQRLTWSGDEYAMCYEVLIDRQEDGMFRRLIQETTTEFFLEVTLFSGKYRYQVISYNFLNQQDSVSEWIEFEVLPAFRPVMSHSRPELNTELNEFMLTVYGRNIDLNAEIILRTDDGIVFTADKTVIMQDGSGIQFTFNNPLMVPDEFEVIVKNPGGLEASYTASSAIPPPPVKYFDCYLGVSFMPLLPLYGMDTISMPGASLRIGLVYRLLGFARFGMEAAGSWYQLDDDKHSIIADLCLIGQKQTYDEKIAFTFRLGAGYTFLIGDEPEHAENIDNFDKPSFHLNTGASVLWLLWKNLYLETGLDFLYMAVNGEGVSCFRPFAGFGIKF